METGKYFRNKQKPFRTPHEATPNRNPKSIETKSDDIVDKQKPKSRMFIWKFILVEQRQIIGAMHISRQIRSRLELGIFFGFVISTSIGMFICLICIGIYCLQK